MDGSQTPSTVTLPSQMIVIDPIHGPVLDARTGGMRSAWFSALDLMQFTIELWARPKLSGEWLVVCQPPDRQNAWVLALGTDGDLALHSPGQLRTTWWNGRMVNDGHWHHLAVAFNGQAPQFFVDGEPTSVFSNTAKQVDALDWDPGVYIGSFANDRSAYGEGLIKSVRISRGVRPASAETLTADEATVALWPFDRVVGDVVPNLAQPKHHGRLVAGVLDDSVSLDAVDRQSFKPGPSPLDGEFRVVELHPGPPARSPIPAAKSQLLDGVWEMAEGAEDLARIGRQWPDAIPATIPGSVHGALENSGRIPDPKHGRNDAIANAESFKTWWFRKRFARPAGDGHRLIFDGVAIHCTIWLNGKRLGEHEGMFGGPTFDIAQLLQDENELVVKIEPAPNFTAEGRRGNAGWTKTVVFNNVYGWHYSNIPALGIWRSVSIQAAPTVRLLSPFVATEHASEGRIKLVVDFEGPAQGWTGDLIATLEPDNFDGKQLHFQWPVSSTGANHRERLRLQIPDVRPWWPNGYGDQCLYRLSLRFVPEHHTAVSHTEVVRFGVRTIAMAPLASGVSSRMYDWKFVVNGRPIFMKGTGWCTMDSSMDFSRARYERFLRLAKDENCQMVRAWGGGMPETDDFYDLCDRLGITVMQEWPTAWNSHNTQPYDMLEETVRLNTLRLRNHPSLLMWGGGNESNKPFGPAIDMMGRYSVELDGTRPFHRGEPWGGSMHTYSCWWGKAHLDYNLTVSGHFLGEFGIASFPVYESVQRYLPKEEQATWPPPAGGSFEYHTPVFNRTEDMDRLRQYAGYFTAGETMERFIVASQVAQSVAVRHTLERARTRWPDCGGALLYKLNDNYPAASWSTVDWYGATKISHWFVQDAFMPVTAIVLFESVNNVGKPLSVPVFLLDDTGKLGGAWQVRVRVYNGELRLIADQTFTGTGPVENGRSQVGTLVLTAVQTNTTPLFITTAVANESGNRISDTFYFVNYEQKKDSLFTLPRTTLAVRAESRNVHVTNTGALPAVGVAVHDSANLDEFSADDNYFWLEPGETRKMTVSSQKQIRVQAWNS